MNNRLRILLLEFVLTIFFNAVVVYQNPHNAVASTTNPGESISAEKRAGCSNSGLEAETLLLLESEAISFAWVTIAEAEKHHGDSARQNSHASIVRILTEARRNNEVALVSVDTTANHPLLVFRLKRRICSTWPQVLEELRKCEFIASFLQTTIGRHLDHLSDDLLRLSDPKKSIADILYLQRFFRLSVNDLCSGCIHSSCVEPLTSAEVKVIAQMAADEYGDHENALEWIRASSEPLSSDEELSIKTLRASCLLKTERYEEAKTAYSELLLPNSSNVAVNSLLNSIDERLKSEESDVTKRNQGNLNKSVVMTSNDDDKSSIEILSTICQKELNSVVRGAGDSLSCQSLKSPTDNSTVDVEWLHKSPVVLLVHDFFMKSQTEAIIRTAKAKSINEAFSKQVINDNSRIPINRIELNQEDEWMDVIESRFRNSTFSQLIEEDFHLTVRSISAGWRENTISSELEKISEISDQQIGIFYIFLNQPKVGGSLIFPQLEVKVEPKQGTAVFWQFESPRSTSLDEAIRESVECPVSLGTQWIAKLSLWRPEWEILPV